MTELLHQANTGMLVDPSQVSIGEWLHSWLEAVVKPRRRSHTDEVYQKVFTTYVTPAIGPIRLQPLQPQHLQQYDAAAERTLVQHHAILSGALKAALMQGQVPRYAATRVLSKPRQFANEEDTDIRDNCWTLEEAQPFLAVIRTADTQIEAFYQLLKPAHHRHVGHPKMGCHGL